MLNSEYCGTHLKGTPYGIIQNDEKMENEVKVWMEEINGIYYYIDQKGNIYDYLEMRESKVKIIGKYEKNNEIYEINISVM